MLVRMVNGSRHNQFQYLSDSLIQQYNDNKPKDNFSYFNWETNEEYILVPLYSCRGNISYELVLQNSYEVKMQGKGDFVFMKYCLCEEMMLSHIPTTDSQLLNLLFACLSQ